MKIFLWYGIGGRQQRFEYTGDVDPLIRQLAGDGLSNSTVSLILRLISTHEELALHQENGFVLHSVRRDGHINAR